MGSLFRTPRVSTNSSVSYDQSLLQGPLSSFYQSQFYDTPAVGQINEVLSGQSQLVNNTASEIYNKALLGPSIREFERVTRPQIENSFAGINGIMSSRFRKALVDAKTDTVLNAQSRLLNEVIPNLNDLAIGGIMAGDSLRFSASDLASAFATANTNSQVQRQGGPGWSLLGTILGSATGAVIGGR